MLASCFKAIVLVTLLSPGHARPTLGLDNSNTTGIGPSAGGNTIPNTGPNTSPGTTPNTNSNTAPVSGGQFSTTQPATKLCGNNQNIILSGTPWLVANSMYGAGSMQGTSCTSYDSIDNSGGSSRVVWGNEIHIQNVAGTDNICKGYANVALTQGFGNTIAGISSVPASYSWTRTNTSPFKGNIVFDFILGPNGDSTSSAAHELMLWLEWDGGQVPIGFAAGPAATIPNLFGTSWKVYEGMSSENGLMVHSALPDTQFSGSFNGDLKDWWEALVGLGRFTDGIFVNIGNAGSEIFWGDSVLSSEIGVQINVG